MYPRQRIPALLIFALTKAALSYPTQRNPLPLDSTHEVSLRPDLKSDSPGSRLGVMHSLPANLDVLRHLVVVAQREGREVAETVEGDCVFRCRETDCTGVSGDVARGDVVGCLGTDQKAVPSNDGVGGERGALERLYRPIC